MLLLANDRWFYIFFEITKCMVYTFVILPHNKLHLCNMAKESADEICYFGFGAGQGCSVKTEIWTSMITTNRVEWCIILSMNTNNNTSK